MKVYYTVVSNVLYQSVMDAGSRAHAGKKTAAPCGGILVGNMPRGRGGECGGTVVGEKPPDHCWESFPYCYIHFLWTAVSCTSAEATQFDAVETQFEAAADS